MNTEIFITEMINTKIIIRKILITKIMKNIGIKRIISFRTFFFAQKFDAGLVSKHKKKIERTEVCLVPNQLAKGNSNSNLVRFNKIQKRFIFV